MSIVSEFKNIYYDIKFLMGKRIYCVIDLGDVFEYEEFHAEIIEWAKQNIKGRISFKHSCHWWWENSTTDHWSFTNNKLEIVSNSLTVSFSRPKDAILFKLRWGNI